jgi:DNA-binding response OmpR family regulator
MTENQRILIVGRDPELIDQVTRRLEMAGFIVTGTTDDGVAIDLAVSADYEALLIGEDMSEPDRRYLTTQSRQGSAGLRVVKVQNTQSVLTQLRQAGVFRG